MYAVVTVNDYLAQRDAEWMGRVHHFLGLSVGLIQVISCFLSINGGVSCTQHCLNNSRIFVGQDSLRLNLIQ